jgi:hypothetical protein
VRRRFVNRTIVGPHDIEANGMPSEIPKENAQAAVGRAISAKRLPPEHRKKRSTPLINRR